MGEISSLFVHKIIAHLDEKHDREPLFAAAGLDPAIPLNPSLMISDHDYYTFFEAAARLDNSKGDLPLRVGGAMGAEDFGAIGLAFKSAPNLGASFRRVERYARMLTSVISYTIEETRDGMLFKLFREGQERLGTRLSNEGAFASYTSLANEVSTASFKPKAVFFRHGNPSHSDAHEQHFGCPVHFDSDKDAMLLSSTDLLTPNRLGDQSLIKFFDQHLEQELAKFDDDVSLEKRLKIKISKALSGGIPSISDISSTMGMSGRTLQRRLSEQGISFQSVVDDARRDLAEKLLRETNFPLTEIAFLVGFSEQSAFNRAFKRWGGQTPRSFRLKVQS